tara:strand:- start:199 stop:429 length:231 start_codon:yes stop_codon:yes gene_type:complete
MKDLVNKPPHYNNGEVEAIDAIKSALGDGFEFYLQGNIMKYIWRYRHKNKYSHKKKLEDLQKAQWYLAKLIEEKSK